MAKQGNTKSGSGKRRWIKWIFLGPILAFILIQLYFFVQVCWFVHFNPGSTSFMRQQLSELREKNPKAELKHQWVPYERISTNLKRAVVASEDANFADHPGVDFDALERAYERNNRKHKVVGGGSTITQQLAKNLFLSGSKSYLRKGQEMIIAFMLETMMDKRRILEVYLNVVEFGRGVFGAEAAARYYFRTSAANLAPAQAARLAVMLPNPRYYDTHRSTNYLVKRTNLIQRRMRAAELP
ncbi:monofunctional biosynthetic peptidoglycan transglycosylase [Massilia sp. Dwa41.01b]|uniref:monofunctional biosynthetic peptidoglycan transglycosylase n=1 Tax=unclassified Massilia TaxID=2609279 RepID=UPI001601E473|nr:MULTISPECIES: monofunctional biosynthetic peptidoglycan transglycosylase [unclassified Massilia]QNA90410.1 monofunctional biosynthetic peptidoglycan transglycosylase [Massilia sp. Dwa41.01b]QNA97637.1 monofunctional biosynthetic peptidoglycan transglycosylase [Massilia sp. Se16.2.3]